MKTSCELSTLDHVLKALQKKQFFKLVCGASLTDIQIIEDLSFLFTLAGAHVIDLAPQASVILAAQKGIEKARVTNSMQQTPILMASIQLDKDPHFRKAAVNYGACNLCGACIKICPAKAFDVQDGKFIYHIERCYGCGVCLSYCHTFALSMIDICPTPRQTLEEVISLGIKAVEFHFGTNVTKVQELWNDIKDLLGKIELISFSIGSNLLTKKEIKKTANICYNLAGEGIILQCDGIPMSGGISKKGNNTDNPALIAAQIIQEENLPVYLQISGGTDENSFSRAISAGININGVAVGSYARRLLLPYLNTLNNKRCLEKALTVAKMLVNSVMKKL